MNKTRLLVSAALLSASSVASAGYFINTDSLTYTGTVTSGGVTSSIGNRSNTTSYTAGGTTSTSNPEAQNVRDLALVLGRDVPAGIVAAFDLAGGGLRTPAQAVNPTQFQSAWYYTTAYQAGSVVMSASSANNPNYTQQGYFELSDFLSVVNSLGGTGSWSSDKKTLTISAGANSVHPLNGSILGSYAGGYAWTGAGQTGEVPATQAGALAILGGIFTDFSISGSFTFAEAAKADALGGAGWYSVDGADPTRTDFGLPSAVNVTVSATFANNNGNTYSYALTLGNDANSWVTGVSARADVGTFGYGSAPGLLTPYFGAPLSASSVPAPFSLALIGIGLVGLGIARRKRI